MFYYFCFAAAEITIPEDAAATFPITADAAEEIQGMTADAGKEIETGAETEMIPAEEDLPRSHHPEALADVKKKIHNI